MFGQWVFVVYGGLFLLALPGMLLSAWLRIRQLRWRSVVQTLGLVVGQNLPLPEALRAAARHEKKALRRVYQRMAARLEAGDQLSTALAASMLSCPGHVVGALQGAEQGGTLPSVLRELAADARRAPRIPTAAGSPTVYSLAMLVLVPVALAFVFVEVVPKFRDVFTDFETALPRATQQLFDLSEAARAASLSLGLLTLAVAVGFFLIVRHFLVRMPMRFRWLTGLVDSLPWHMPIFRRAAEIRSLARQLPILQAGLRAGHDLAPAARQAACVDANYFSRRRLNQWAAALEGGADPLGAARRLRFPGPVLRALTVSAGGANLPAALEYLVAYYRSLLVHWSRVLLSAVMPLVVIAWGLCVGYIAVALFLPLVALIQTLAASVG